MSETNTDKPDVIQGRLGWESGDTSEATPAELEPHPKNRAIYGDTDDADELDTAFRESVQEKGVLEPVVVTNGKQIISGHRRWLAAKDAGLEAIPIRYAEFDSELAEREALVEFNRQREKTPGQVVNEFEEILKIERQRAKRRQKEGGEVGGKGSGNVTKPLDDTGASRDKAAEKVNADVSGQTLEKGLKVKQKAEQGDETAKKKWKGLQTGEESFSGAYEAVNDSKDEDKDTNDIEQFTSQKTDEWSSPKNLVKPISDSIGGFDLDPCSGAEQSPFAKQTFTESDDGLSKSWNGNVWVNPPYSSVSKWVDKAISEIEDGEANLIVFLCKGDSSTNWWHRAASASRLITAINGRLQFGDGDNSAPFPSHIIIFGDTTEGLRNELQNHGKILIPGCPK